MLTIAICCVRQQEFLGWPPQPFRRGSQEDNTPWARKPHERRLRKMKTISSLSIKKLTLNSLSETLRQSPAGLWVSGSPCIVCVSAVLPDNIRKLQAQFALVTVKSNTRYSRKDHFILRDASACLIDLRLHSTLRNGERRACKFTVVRKSIERYNNRHFKR